MAERARPSLSFSSSILRATAYHEAGHAVAAIARQRRFSYMTIEPDHGRGSAGHVRFSARQGGSIISLHTGAVIALAGEAAQRQFSPRSIRLHQSDGDRAIVADAALLATGSAEQAGLLVKFWTVCARDLIASRWTAVNQVAAALLDRRRLTYAEVLAVAKPS